MTFLKPSLNVSMEYTDISSRNGREGRGRLAPKNTTTQPKINFDAVHGGSDSLVNFTP